MSDLADRRPRRLAALAIGSAMALLCWPGSAATANARAAGGLEVVPRPATNTGLSYFTPKARPGQTGDAGTIELDNRTRRAMTVALSAVDGATLGGLGSTYLPAGSNAHGSTSWLRLGSRTLRLQAGARATVAVSVAVPGGAAAGQYLSGVSVEALDQPNGGAAHGGIAIASALRYAIGVEVDVPGALQPAIGFTGATLAREPAGLTFYLDARNTGNAILHAHGHVLISSAGHTVLSRAMPEGTFVSHTAIAYPVPALRQAPAQGTRYEISAWLRYRGGIARLNTSLTFGRTAAILQRHYAVRTHRSGGTEWWKSAVLIAAIAYGVLTTLLLLALWRRRREARHRGADGTDSASGADGASGMGGANGTGGTSGADGASGRSGMSGAGDTATLTAEPMRERVGVDG